VFPVRYRQTYRVVTIENVQNCDSYSYMSCVHVARWPISVSASVFDL
jgi:hypothetical protein